MLPVKAIFFGLFYVQFMFSLTQARLPDAVWERSLCPFWGGT